MPYRALFFDADDTLFDYPTAERAALNTAMRHFGIEVDEEQLLRSYRAHNADVWKAYERGEMSQLALRAERFRRLKAELQLHALEEEMASALYLDTLSEQAHVFEGAEDFVAELAPRWPLAMITNGIASVQRRRFAKAPLVAHFSSIVISEEAGCAKPDPRIFEPAYAALGVDARTVLFIGDSVTSDMAAARNAGMDFCWYNPSGAPVPDGHAPRFVARSYDDIREFVGLK
jgi:2-haloacid dehalogenase